MPLVQIFLPIADNQGNPFSEEIFKTIFEILTKRFGGITAFTQALADGLWEKGNEVQKDRIMFIEVMTENIEAEWWAKFRNHLETVLKQEEILIRSLEVQKL